MELLCTEGDTVKRAYRDPVFLKDERVLENLLRVEEFYLIPARYLETQTEVKPYMRRIVLQWMYEVSKTQHWQVPIPKFPFSY